MSTQEPICGWLWFTQHQRDITQEQIDRQSLVIMSQGKKQTIPNDRRARGIARDTVRDWRKENAKTLIF